MVIYSLYVIATKFNNQYRSTKTFILFQNIYVCQIFKILLIIYIKSKFAYKNVQVQHICNIILTLIFMMLIIINRIMYSYLRQYTLKFSMVFFYIPKYPVRQIDNVTVTAFLLLWMENDNDFHNNDVKARTNKNDTSYYMTLHSIHPIPNKGRC